ncbi:hypothetical protein RA2_04081 [Roseovarius sp. A-2]|uniref:glycine-rich domain-containing protein n=1 Tax=Roseovarius sp. A-2 TaxID=1570360 RepID=UPI0009D34DB0|nr:hypothetical protein [Roseovarius sp. A-2]GAW37006.1 hypothetical protein RA2_04081 [Roseovarius sp. A-2]
MSFQTQLRIFRSNGLEIPFPPGSYRWADISTRPIRSASQTARTIDGRLVSLGDPAFRQLEVTISVSDQIAPALDNLWEGDELTIHSPDYMTEAGGVLTLSREPVPGTVTAHAVDGTVLASPESRTVNVPDAVYVRYRPIFGVKVTAPLDKRATEGKARVSWTLVTEEDEAVEIVEPAAAITIDIMEATGGDILDYTASDGIEIRSHTFLSSGTFTVTKAGYLEDGWVIAGGGGGARHDSDNVKGGGASAGQARRLRNPDGTRIWLEPGIYSIEVGAGGPGAVGNNNGSNGSPSEAFGIQALGGGAGGTTTGSPGPGGGGGGGVGSALTGGPPFGNAIGTLENGHRGGAGRVASSSYLLAGGGAGASEPGRDGATSLSSEHTSEFTGAKGGDGLKVFCRTGLEEWYAGGGSPGISSRYTPQSGGQGGGGTGASGGSSAGNGAQNTGGGGGGADYGAAGSGGSGIVIIAYRRAV